jgi:hypothetical protein
LAASPVRSFREDLPPVSKKQLLERLPHLQNMPAKFCHEEGLILLGDDWYKPHTNIYLLNHRLISARRRRSQFTISSKNTGGASGYKLNLCFEKISGGGFDDNNCLYLLNGKEIAERDFNTLLNSSKEDNSCTFTETREQRPKKPPKNQEKEKQK